MTKREEFIQHISAMKEEQKRARGQKNRAELRKAIFRAERELAHYDRRQREAAHGA